MPLHLHSTEDDVENNHAFGANRRALLVAMGITVGIMVVEAIGGFWANSLALLSDAGHMLMDVLALGLSLIALQFTVRPASPTKTYGFYRMEILAALVNGSSLLLICGFIMYEAYRRFKAPEEVDTATMLVVAAIGLVANVGAAMAMTRRSKESLNLRGAYLHIIGDALSSIGVILGGLIIRYTGWQVVDPIISALICVVIFRGALKLVGESVHILLESVPRNLDLAEIQKELLRIPGVKDLHDVHLWTISSGIYAMSAHVLVDDILMSRTGEILQEVNRLLRSHYGIEHTTIQFECENCEEGFYCDVQAGCVGVTRRQRQPHGPTQGGKGR
ncbi:MAG: cation diffusion facilitator family transporter [Thermodesulfobacteriota bacterium]